MCRVSKAAIVIFILFDFTGMIRIAELKEEEELHVFTEDYLSLKLKRELCSIRATLNKDV